MILKRFLKVIAITFGFAFTANVFANVDHFEIEFGSESVELWNYIDLTIKALDRNDNIVTDYAGEVVIISDTDVNVELPSSISENLFEFDPANKWVAKFENGLKFSSVWTHDLYVYDSEDTNILGLAEIEVTEATEIQNVDNRIITPNDNSTVWNDTVIINWTTIKNHTVKITLNNENQITTQSNSDGLYEAEITWLVNWNNLIKASTLNAEGNKIWDSQIITVVSDTSLPELISFEATPAEVNTGDEITFKVISEEDLTEVKVIFNDAIIRLEENEESKGEYLAKAIAPDVNANLDVIVKLTDELGHTKEDIISEAITITKNSEPTLEPAPTEEQEVAPAQAPVTELWVVKNLKVTKLKGKSIISWDKETWAEWYKIYKKDLTTGEKKYIETVNDNKYVVHIAAAEEDIYEDFSVKAYGKNSEGEAIESPEFSEMVKVQTWPAEILLLLIFSMVVGYMIMRKRSAM